MNEELARHQAAIERLEEQRRVQQGQERELRRSIAENGGDRIESLAQEILQHQTKLEHRKQRAGRYEGLVRSLGQSPAKNEEVFLRQRSQTAIWRDNAKEAEAKAQNDITQVNVEFAQGRQEYDQLQTEIKGLKARVSNIDEKQITIRRLLCQSLDVAEEEMPFAGELIQVRQEERDWEGAIERLLHGFGLSLLVPDRYYAKVAQWVDQTHLRGRLVYFRVLDKDGGEMSSLRHDSLIRKLQIKSDSPLYDWMERELTRRFDVACCVTQDRFFRETRAITRNGQIKMPGQRHEKDDRHRIDDRRRYVLGWSNAEKIAVLERQAQQQEACLAELATRISALQEKQADIGKRLDILSRLDEYTDFRDMDWRPCGRANRTAGTGKTRA